MTNENSGTVEFIPPVVNPQHVSMKFSFRNMGDADAMVRKLLELQLPGVITFRAGSWYAVTDTRALSPEHAAELYKFVYNRKGARRK